MDGNGGILVLASLFRPQGDILEGLTVCLNLHQEAPHYIREAVQAKLQHCEL
ncbi:hypothetical protein M404DRAFT_20128 [Pisolithus tinctorius Marx 270]|uniref:Uncharacterized protein n=1 Tax=Pisolithus tinctorius Marx 270 TaxID=870435 RepID=A0A0C3PSZ2_PISTI|nr:hypothetical protein M404DRAFT_20128 [Pisolithus tinctorius Marx 270]